jgi:hypothetical protein
VVKIIDLTLVALLIPIALLAVTIVAIGEVAGHAAFPPPPGLTIDPHDPASMNEVMEKIPLAAKVVLALA